MIVKVKFNPCIELAIFNANIKGGLAPERFWAFGVPQLFQDLGIVATGIDANGEYAPLLSVVRSQWHHVTRLPTYRPLSRAS